MPVKKQSTERRRSTRIQHKEEEKAKRTNLKDLLNRSNSTTSRPSSSTEKDGDFIFKRAGTGVASSQPVTDFEKQLSSSTSDRTNGQKRSRPNSKSQKTNSIIPKKPMRRLNAEDVSITPQRHSPKKRSKRDQDRYNENEYEEHSTSFQIALPISDTPIIRRNQKYRKEIEKRDGIRRSSLGNRGKRVSSIGNGFSAIPHDKVPTNEFFKHLDSDLPDPHKMRQLLTWTAKRVLEEDKNRHIKRKNKLPNEELTALNIAKFIKEELVNDLSNGKINISWWNRSDEDDESTSKEDGTENKLEKTLLPNEKNLKNAEVLKELKQKLEKLKKDSIDWEKHLARKIDYPSFQVDLETPLSIPSGKQQQQQQHLNNEAYSKIIDSSTISEISQIEDSTFNAVNNDLEKSVDGFSEFVHFLKSSSSIRNRFVSLKSKQLSNILDETFDDDTIEIIKSNSHNTSYQQSHNDHKEIDTHNLLKGISRLDK